MQKIDIIAIIAVVCAVFFSCSIIKESSDTNVRGLFEGGEIIPADATKIHIRKFSSENNINFNTIELLNQLKRNLTIDERLNIVDNDKDAEIILSGKITAYTIQPVKFTPQRIAELKRMRLTIALTLYNTDRDKTIFQNRPVEAMHEFSDINHPVETELRAELNLIDKIIPKIISQLFTGWYTDKYESGRQRKR